MTRSSFFHDLKLAARRLGYPLDSDAERLLASALDMPEEEWRSNPYKRSHAATRGRRMLMRAVQLALSSGLICVDGTTMAVAIADDELPQSLPAPRQAPDAAASVRSPARVSTGRESSREIARDTSPEGQSSFSGDRSSAVDGRSARLV